MNKKYRVYQPTIYCEQNHLLEFSNKDEAIKYKRKLYYDCRRYVEMPVIEELVNGQWRPLSKS